MSAELRNPNSAISRKPAPERELIDAQLDIVRRGDPVRFLRAFLAIARRADRFSIAWDFEALDFLARVFGEAAVAAVGHDRLREDLLHEQRKFAMWAKALRGGEHERGQIGFTFLDQPADWPAPVVIVAALQVLQLADLGELA